MEIAGRSVSRSTHESTERRWRAATTPPSWLVGVIVPIALLGLWQWLVNREVYTRSQLPAPKDVWLAAEQLWNADLLLEHITISSQRVMQGFLWGAGIAILIGLAVGLSPLFDRLFSPTIQAMRAIPSLAWVPLLVLWIGIGDTPKITLVAIGVFFPVFTALVGGIQQIDRKLIEVGQAYGLRIGLAQGWLFLVAAGSRICQARAGPRSPYA